MIITQDTREPAYFAVRERPADAAREKISPLSAAAYKNRYQAMLPSFEAKQAKLASLLAPPGKWIIFNSFEDGIGSWSNRDGDVGATLAVTRKGCRDGYCLQLTDREGGGNFASTITTAPFDAEKYPWVRFDYKIPPDVKINLQVRVEGRWYDILFTDDPKQYRRLSLEPIGQIAGVKTDTLWPVRWTPYHKIVDIRSYALTGGVRIC